ncbi:MAG: transporter, family, cyanate transporter [Chloroflexota bacterium]|nr:transporter, family, cyanate transporter [Chloroflexota bacterium]
MVGGGALTLLIAWWVGFNLRAVLLGVPPVLDRVQHDLGLSYTAAGLLTSLPILVLGVAALPGAALVRRLGGHRTVALGLLAVAAGTPLRAAGGVLPLYAGTVLLALGISVAQPGLPLVLQARFPAVVQRASTTVSCGLITGELVAASITVPVLAPLTGGGWRGSFLAWTAPAVLAAGAWLLVGADRPPGRAGPGSGPTARRSARLWWASTIFAAQSLTYFSANTWIPTSVAGGPDSRSATVALIVLNGVQLPVALALITTRRAFVRSRGFYVAAGALAAAGVLGWLVAADAAVPLWTALIGAGVSMTFAALLAYPPSVEAPADVAGFTAVMLTAGYCAAFTGPLLGGAVLDLVHWRRAPFLPIAVATAVMVLAALRPPPRTIEPGQGR